MDVKQNWWYSEERFHFDDCHAYGTYVTTCDRQNSIHDFVRNQKVSSHFFLFAEKWFIKLILSFV